MTLLSTGLGTTPPEATTRGRLRGAALGVIGTLAAGAAAITLHESALRRWPGSAVVSVEDALATLVLGAAGALSAWAFLVLALATASLLPTAGTPRVGGLTARVAAGLVIAASVGAAPALAAPTGAGIAVVASASRPESPGAADRPGAPPETTVPESGAVGAPVPGWTPTVSRAPAPTPTAEVGLVSTAVEGRAEAEVVVVVRGDTLWSIAARHLGDQASDQDITEAWPRWYAANRDVIGADPDHIVPGQVLRAPVDEGRP